MLSAGGDELTLGNVTFFKLMLSPSVIARLFIICNGERAGPHRCRVSGQPRWVTVASGGGGGQWPGRSERSGWG